jgi:predicted RNA binding protein YcfA (HicA-like mRNA interferase family)
MPRKIRELKADLKRSGFIRLKGRGKGSHSRWLHPWMPDDRVTLCGKDGADAPVYLERQVMEKLKRLETLKRERGET